MKGTINCAARLLDDGNPTQTFSVIACRVILNEWASRKEKFFVFPNRDALRTIELYPTSLLLAR